MRNKNETGLPAFFREQTNMSIENKPLTIGDLALYYKHAQLVKPRLNRDLRWDFEHTKLFLEFTFKIRHILTPFLCTQIVCNKNGVITHVMSVFDGNNRMNGIFSFLVCPLKYLTSANNELKSALCIKPDGEKIYRVIASMTYEEIMETTSISMLCDIKPHIDGIDLFEWVRTNEDRNRTIEKSYNTMRKTVSDTQFHNVKLNLTVFSGMSDSEIVDIFKNINTSGVELTPQDILKSTASLTTYNAEEITDFGNIVNYYRAYAEKQSQNEMLISDSTYTVLSGFEILYGLQLWMSCKYNSVVDAPGKKGVKLDFIFKLHRLFETNDANAYSLQHKDVSGMNAFIAKFQKSTEYLNSVYEKMFGLVGSQGTLGLSLNNQFAVHSLYFADGNSTKFHTEYFVVLLNDVLCSFVKDKHTFTNPLAYKAGGNAIIDLTYGIKINGYIQNVPTKENVREILNHLIQQYIEPCKFADKKRKYKATKFETLLLNMYFYKHIPPYIREEPLHLDHIIPIKTNGWSGEMDINRIGNKMLINSRVNLKKGCGALTDAFIAENKLAYFNYPTENEYSKIVVDGIVQHREYNTFCEKREQAYVYFILNSIF